MVQNISESNFEDLVLKSNKPVLVDFWAPWCGPCKSFGPIVEDIAVEYSDKLNVYKFDVDTSDKISETYKIRGIPCSIIFENGMVKAQQPGAMSKTQLKTFLDRNLG